MEGEARVVTFGNGLRMSLRAAAALAGCATTHDAGWTGKGAMPFDAAQSDCDAKTKDLPAGKQREAAFDQCMEEHGWRRP